MFGRKKRKIEDMKKVTRYLCEFCGKEFKTSDRHKCRWSPDAHNCLSCKHRGSPHTDCNNWTAFDCPFFEDPCEAPCDLSKGAVSKKGNGCPHWELVDGYEGKKTFAMVESERIRTSKEDEIDGEDTTDEDAGFH